MDIQDIEAILTKRVTHEDLERVHFTLHTDKKCLEQTAAARNHVPMQETYDAAGNKKMVPVPDSEPLNYNRANKFVPLEDIVLYKNSEFIYAFRKVAPSSLNYFCKVPVRVKQDDGSSSIEYIERPQYIFANIRIKI